MEKIPIVFIGHKDHGKSTLIGRLILDSKSIKESQVKEIKKVQEALGQKFELAHLVDSFKEERERGMTIDTVRVALKGRKRDYQLIDVPGHEELIANMLTGAAGAQVAILVVSVEEGIKEQTRQHLEIAKLLGIEQLAVGVNKIDIVAWREEKFHQIKQELKKILNQIGYSSETVHFFPISAREGDNVFQNSPKTPWYQGEPLIDFIENKIKPPQSLENYSAVFLVQDVYGDLLVGRVESGRLRINENLFVLPANKSVKIISIHDATGELSEAIFGQNVGIKVSRDRISRGDVLAEENSSLRVGKELVGEMFWLEEPATENLMLCLGFAQVRGTLKNKQDILRGNKSLYQILLKEPIVFDPTGKTILGKVVLKEEGRIIGVGNIKKEL